MDGNSIVLDEIVKAKDCIKRKYNALKNGEANVQKLMSQTLKPVIDPLEKISNQSSHTPTSSQIEEKNKQLVVGPVDSFLKKELESEEENTPEAQYNIQRILKWFNSCDLDKTYGPKIDYASGDITLGNKKINFDQNTLIIDDGEYMLTPGLIQLLFKKHPTLYTEYDLQTYKSILVQTSAHLTSNGVKVKKSGNKYVEIIKKLFPTSGSGLCIKLQKHNLVYWDDPNELVDRLKLLLSSQAAGNTGVSNEIISIFEELLEAGLIKRIPNV